MIYDKFEYINLYRGITECLDSAIDFISSADFSGIDDGEIEIDGRDLFAVIETYETSDAGSREYENHRKYIDLQFLVRGKELIGCTPLSELGEGNGYDPERDLEFYPGDPGSETLLPLAAGYFAVFFPHDAHKPGCTSGNVPSKVRKCVVKISVE